MTAATASPQAVDVATASSVEPKLRSGGTLCSRVISICVTSAHTLPGTYFPSWEIPEIRKMARTGSGDPSPARNSRQPSIQTKSPASPAASAAASVAQDICWNARTVSSHWDATL